MPAPFLAIPPSGVVVRCTKFVVLFVAAMNLLIKADGIQCRGPKADDDTRHPASRAFMDDITDDSIDPGNTVDPNLAGKGGYTVMDAIHPRKIWKPKYPERKDDKHLHYSRV